MALTTDFRLTMYERAARDPEFVQALVNEGISLFCAGEASTARLILRDTVNATCGFERLAASTGVPVKSLHRMLSQKGNPSMDNLSTILAAMQQELKLEVAVQSTPRKSKKHQLAAKTASDKGKGKSIR